MNKKITKRKSENSENIDVIACSNKDEIKIIARENILQSRKNSNQCWNEIHDGDVSLTINKETLQMLDGIIPQEIATTIHEMFNEHESLAQIKDDQEIKNIIQKSPEQMVVRSQALRYLLSIKNQINDEKESSKMLPLFKKNLDDDHFGVTKTLMDRLNYLPEVLKNAI